MKKLCFTIICIGLLASARAQWSVGAEVFSGTFSMASIKKEQSLSQNFHIPLKVVQNFPSRAGINLKGYYAVNELLHAGIHAGFISTGSRMTYSDYTGTFNRDLIVSGRSIGAGARMVMPFSSKFRFNFGIQVGAIFNTASLRNQITLTQPDYTLDEKAKWRSVNMYEEVRATAGKWINRFLLEISAGYQTSSSGKMKLSKKSGNTEASDNPDWVIEWDGFRIGAGVIVKLGKSEQ
jgi:hypothetical protein